MLREVSSKKSPMRIEPGSPRKKSSSGVQRMQGWPSTLNLVLLCLTWAMSTDLPRGLFPLPGSPNVTKAERSKSQICSRACRTSFWKYFGVRGIGQWNSFRASAPSEEMLRRAWLIRAGGQPKIGEFLDRSSLVCHRSWAISHVDLGACWRIWSKPWSTSVSSFRLTGFSSQIGSSQIGRVFLKQLPWKKWQNIY